MARGRNKEFWTLVAMKYGINSPKEFSKRTGISKSTILFGLAGKQIMQISTRQKLCKVISAVDINKYFGGNK